MHFFVGLLSLFLLIPHCDHGTITKPVQKLDLNGVLGRPVIFSININSREGVESIDWEFQSENGSELLLAVFKDGEMKRFNPEDRFERRLKFINETTLRIKKVEAEDGGEYKIRVKFSSAKIQTHKVSLKVYEPVPQPQIHPAHVSQSLHGCNVTLQCLTSGEGTFNISWKIGNPLKDLEWGSDWCHLSPNGSELYLSWQPGSLDPNFTCLISNPADQESISFDLRHICKSKSESKLFLWWILPVFLILLFSVLGFWIWRKRILNRDIPHTHNQKLSESPNSAIAKRRKPPERDEDQELDHLSEQSPTTTQLSTVYAQLQSPTCSFDQVT